MPDGEETMVKREGRARQREREGTRKRRVDVIEALIDIQKLKNKNSHKAV